MKITKEAGVQGLSQVGEEDLALINALARRELKAEEVYTFAVRLCDNDIDRDGERFAVETLEELAGLFTGAPGIFDHQWSAKGQTARIYRTELVREKGVLTRDGQEYCYLKGYAYMMRTAENEGLIAEIDGGIKREVSVGCSVERMECSICGADMRSGGCGHEKGQVYDGQLCAGVLLGAKDAYEWSFVAVPAQKKAGVVKGAKDGGTLEQEAELGRRYLKELRREVVRLGCLAEKELDRGLLERVTAKLDREELDGLRRAYQAQADKLFRPESQLWAADGSRDETGADSAFLI